MFNLVLAIKEWVQFTRRAATDPPSMQRSLRKQPRGPRRKQDDMAPA